MYKMLLSVLLLLATLPAFAEEERPWWKFWNEQNDIVATAIENQLFTEDERTLLDEYLRGRHVNKHDDDIYEKKSKKHKKDKKQKALPPGLQKKVERGGELPPGWQKKIARGEVLDGDLYLASKGLPKDILDRLPSGPDGTSIRQIEDTIVRVMDATGVILDVLKGNVE